MTLKNISRFSRKKHKKKHKNRPRTTERTVTPVNLAFINDPRFQTKR